MRRRDLLSLLSAAAAGLPLATAAQVRPSLRVGYLHPGTPAIGEIRLGAFREGLGTEWPSGGRGVDLIVQVADGDPDRLPAMARELVSLPVDAIVAGSPSAVRAASNATRTIPIVAVDLESDPVANGWAGSLARPGGNITGVFLDLPEISAKCLQLLREAVGSLDTVGIVWDVATGSLTLRAVEIATAALGIRIEVYPVRRVADVALAVNGARDAGLGGIMLLSSPIIGSNAKLLAELTAKQRVPTVTLFPEFAQMGGLIAYGPDLQSLFRQAAVLTRKVLEGAATAELPIQRPERFQLVANAKTAREIGLSFPGSILVRADEVIE